MSINGTLPIVFVQELGPAARMAHEAAVRPEFAQAMAQQLAEAQLRHESQQIQKPSESEKGTLVSDDGKGGSPGQQGQRRSSKEREKEAESSPSSESPFLGNLVNRKV